MPKITDFEGPRPGIISTAVSPLDINPNAYGGPEQAANQIGQTIADVGQMLLQKRKDAEDRDFAFTRSLEDARAVEAYQQELRLKIPEDGAGYSEAIQKFINDRYTKNQKEAPSETSKQLYQARSGELLNRQIIEARGFEFTQKAKAYVTNIHKEIDFTASTMINTPSVPMAQEAMQATEQHINESVGKTIDQATANMLKDRNRGDVAKGLLQGLYNKGLAATNIKEARVFFQEGLDLLRGVSVGVGKKGNEGLDSISSFDITYGLKPEERETLQKAFINKLKERHTENLQELNARVRDTISSQVQGKRSDATNVMRDMWGEVAAGNVPLEQAVRTQDEMNMSEATGQLAIELRSTPRSQWDATEASLQKKVDAITARSAQLHPEMASVSAPGFNQAARDRYQSSIIPGIREAIKQEQNADPADFVNKSDPKVASLYQLAQSGKPADMQRYVEANLRRQEYLEIDKPRILTNEHKAMFAAQLSTRDATELANNFSAMEQAWGPYFSRVFSESVADKNSPVDDRMWVASYFQGPARGIILKQIINSKNIDTAFATKYPDIKPDELTQEINAQAADMIDAIRMADADGGSLAKAEAIRRSLELMAKSQAVTTTANVSPKDAVQRAVGVLRSHFDTIQAADSSVILPKFVNQRRMNPQIVEAWMVAHKRADGLAELNPWVPPGVDKQRYYQVLQKNAFWVMSPAGDALRLEWTNPATGKREAVTTDGKTPLTRKLESIINDPGKRTHDELKKGRLRKFMDKAEKAIQDVVQ
jgi:hypothetical protein